MGYNDNRRSGRENRGGFGGGNRGGRGGFGGGRKSFGGRDSGRPEMHKAICSDCGRECEVPFRPTGDKPVYCNDCFKRDDDRSDRSGGRDRGKDRGRDRGRSNFEERRMYDAICAECGNRCEVPFKPSGDKPVLCNSCFDGSGKSGPKKPDLSDEKFEELNKKLDKILRILDIISPKKVHIIKKGNTESENSDPHPEDAEEKKEVKPKKKTPAKKTATKKVAKKKTSAKKK